MSVQRAIKLCLLKDVYPDVLNKLQYLKQLLRACANKIGDVAIEKCLKHDYDYFLLLKTVVSSPFI